MRTFQLCVFASLFCITIPVFAQPKEAYKFGIFPHLSLTRLLQVYSPIALEFEKRLNKSVQITTRADYRQYADELMKETYDIAFIQPFDYPEAHDLHNYIPIARRHSPLTSIHVTRKDSSIERLEQIKGRTIAYPSPYAAVTLLSKKAIMDLKIDIDKDVKLIYTKNHFSCMQMVLIQKADLCATARQAMAFYTDVHMSNRFRIVYETSPIPHTLFVVHARVPENEKKALLQTVLSWKLNALGEKLPQNASAPFVRATDEEYNVIRRFWNDVKRK